MTPIFHALARGVWRGASPGHPAPRPVPATPAPERRAARGSGRHSEMERRPDRVTVRRPDLVTERRTAAVTQRRPDPSTERRLERSSQPRPVRVLERRGDRAAAHRGDPVVEFELDPLRAPIPTQVMAERSTLRVLRTVSGGRHRR